MSIQMNSLSHHLVSIFLLPPLLLFYLASPAISQPHFLSHICADDYGNYTSNSTFKANLHTFLSSITSNTQIDYGFYNLSVGQNFDKVSGVALCRGDVSTPDCLTCIRLASTRITQECTSQKTALGLYEDCMIWYSNSNMFKGLNAGVLYNMSYSEVQNLKSFNDSVSNLLLSLARKAAMGDYRRKFATGEAKVNSKQTAYALLQCVPDMEEYDCLECLWLVMNFTLADCCYGKRGAWAVAPSCSIRYDIYKFYNSATVLPPLTSPPSLLSPPFPTSITTTKGNRSKKSEVVTIILIATAAPLLLLIVLACYCLRRTRKPLKKVENEDADEDETKMVESLQMDFGMIKAAADNFSTSNQLGNGGFGTVYKGRLSNGQAIAVKRLNKNSGQGKQEFKNEALLMAKLQHRNLVRFLGFCIHKDEKLFVYELLPNKSLDYYLFDPNKRIYLDWPKRQKIIQGVARGLLYLHEESRLLVVHRDLKPGNILLDVDMNPKISDFGMARLFGVDQSRANTSKIVGTNGYMPPEYVLHGQFSIKSDVFSFGVLVLEILSGQKVSEFSEAENGESLLGLAWRSWLEGNALSLVDSTMTGANTTEVLRCIHIGLLCVQGNAAQRPIMSSVVLMLNSHTVTLPVPCRPAFLVQNDPNSEPLQLAKQMTS